MGITHKSIDVIVSSIKNVTQLRIAIMEKPNSLLDDFADINTKCCIRILLLSSFFYE